ncbi:unnamed protein product [Vitrella brassicaformis CCMP3155]|uniref:Uncharacterized protein n=3 Tax=Vitrella brassicaformis TaxID=1169539 RepID=A0A0G4G7A8_VITBC|nr:unnamed protein product [Vitrella brassicaformis CCMP3155]|eukprot:CEM24428.1 unnamed protein product [Vitrella brassicaformis CCMP3155]
MSCPMNQPYQVRPSHGHRGSMGDPASSGPGFGHHSQPTTPNHYQMGGRAQHDTYVNGSSSAPPANTSGRLMCGGSGLLPHALLKQHQQHDRGTGWKSPASSNDRRPNMMPPGHGSGELNTGSPQSHPNHSGQQQQQYHRHQSGFPASSHQQPWMEPRSNESGGNGQTQGGGYFTREPQYNRFADQQQQHQERMSSTAPQQTQANGVRSGGGGGGWYASPTTVQEFLERYHMPTIRVLDDLTERMGEMEPLVKQIGPVLTRLEDVETMLTSMAQSVNTLQADVNALQADMRQMREDTEVRAREEERQIDNRLGDMHRRLADMHRRIEDVVSTSERPSLLDRVCVPEAARPSQLVPSGPPPAVHQPTTRKRPLMNPQCAPHPHTPNAHSNANAANDMAVDSLPMGGNNGGGGGFPVFANGPFGSLGVSSGAGGGAGGGDSMGAGMGMGGGYGYGGGGGGMEVDHGMQMQMQVQDQQQHNMQQASVGPPPFVPGQLHHHHHHHQQQPNGLAGTSPPPQMPNGSSPHPPTLTGLGSPDHDMEQRDGNTGGHSMHPNHPQHQHQHSRPPAHTGAQGHHNTHARPAGANGASVASSAEPGPLPLVRIKRETDRGTPTIVADAPAPPSAKNNCNSSNVPDVPIKQEQEEMDGEGQGSQQHDAETPASGVAGPCVGGGGDGDGEGQEDSSGSWLFSVESETPQHQVCQILGFAPDRLQTIDTAMWMSENEVWRTVLQVFAPDLLGAFDACNYQDTDSSVRTDLSTTAIDRLVCRETLLLLDHVPGKNEAGGAGTVKLVAILLGAILERWQIQNDADPSVLARIAIVLRGRGIGRKIRAGAFKVRIQPLVTSATTTAQPPAAQPFEGDAASHTS